MVRNNYQKRRFGRGGFLMLLDGLMTVMSLSFCCEVSAFTPSSTAFSITGQQSSSSSSLTTTTTQLQCQLLGMNCATPTDFTFSFVGFCERGGNTDIHRDGWGLAFYDGKGLRAFHDVESASHSPVAAFLKQLPIRTLNMISHIRYATQGGHNLANVHPFQRELWGCNWVFAHNGDVPLFNDLKGGDIPWIGEIQKGERTFNPVGTTDSEALFCAVMNALKTKFDRLPSLPVLHSTIQALCQEIVDFDADNTILNFLLTCGEHNMFAYSWPGSRPNSNVWNGLHYTVREYPFKRAKLQDLDYEVDFAHLTKEEDRVAVIATKPLTMDEEWVEMERGQLILFDDGVPHKESVECFMAELNGHGLSSSVLPAPKLEEDLRRFSNSKAAVFAGSGI